MSIAELIMTGTNRASESTAWVGDSLAKLGQNVGAALAQREQQKQAQEMLPFLQQSMQESMTLAGEGKSGEAYAKLMPFITNPSVINNPNLMPAVDAALKLNEIAANNYLRNRQISAYESRYSGGTGGGGGGGLPAGPSAFFNQNPADTEPLPTDPNLTQPVDEMPQGAGGAMPEFTGQFYAGLNEPTQELPWSYQNPDAVQPTPEVKKSFEQNQQEYLGASPDKQQAYQNNLSSTTTPIGTNVSQFDFSNIKSLRNVVGIAAPVEKQVEVPESMTMTENAKGTSYSTKFNKKTTNDNVIQKSSDLVLTDLPKALSRISSNKTLSKFFKENELGNLDIGETVKNVEDEAGVKKTEKSFYIGIDGQKDSYITISQDDFTAASTVQNLPSSARTLDSTFIITDKPLPKEEPAAEAPAPTERFPVKPTAKTETGTPAKSTKELTLEEQLAQEASSGSKTLARTATPEQLKGVEKSKISQKKSTLESEKMKLESLLYDVARATGRKTLKAGISANTKSKAEARIAEINKELEGL
jgi:hypothetical protein